MIAASYCEEMPAAGLKVGVTIIPINRPSTIPDVLQLKADGLSDNKIAKQLGISGHRVARVVRGQTHEAGAYLSDLTLEDALK